MGADRIGFHADPEYLGLNGNINLASVIRNCKNPVQRIFEAFSGRTSVCRKIFEPIRNPDVQKAGLACLLREIFRDFKATDIVLDPELSDFLVPRGKGSVFCERMGEICGVKIQSQMVFLREVHPLFEVPGFDLIAVHPLAVLKDGVRSVEVQLVMFSRNIAERLLDVTEKLFIISCTVWIISGGLNASGKRSFLIESYYIVALPAVHGQRDGCRSFHRAFYINAELFILFYCFFISFFNCH